MSRPNRMARTVSILLLRPGPAPGARAAEDRAKWSNGCRPRASLPQLIASPDATSAGAAGDCRCIAMIPQCQGCDRLRRPPRQGRGHLPERKRTWSRCRSSRSAVELAPDRGRGQRRRAVFMTERGRILLESKFTLAGRWRGPVRWRSAEASTDVNERRDLLLCALQGLFAGFRSRGTAGARREGTVPSMART